MEPKTIERHPAVGGLTEEDLYGEDSLDEIEVEFLIGHHVELDEEEDWRAIDL